MAAMMLMQINLLVLTSLQLALTSLQPFVGRHLSFHNFFHPGFLRPHLFHSLAVFVWISSSKASLWLTLIIPFNFFLFITGIVEDCVAI